MTLCECATKYEWLPEHYTQAHHPLCQPQLDSMVQMHLEDAKSTIDEAASTLSKLRDIPAGQILYEKIPLRAKSEGQLSKRQFRSLAFGDWDCEFERMMAQKNLAEENQDEAIVEAVLRALRRRSPAARKLKELLDLR